MARSCISIPGPGPPKQQAFRRLSNRHKLITTGCNFPIFRAGLYTPEVFKRPNKNFHGQKFFDADDVLGCPIKEMSDSFNVDWISDTKVSVGGFLTGWNPISHLKYWTDKDVLRPIANEITGIVES